MAGLLLYLWDIRWNIINLLLVWFITLITGSKINIVRLYKLENLSTQFFMIQIMRHLLLASMYVCMLRLWESRITQIRDARRRGMPVCLWIFRIDHARCIWSHIQVYIRCLDEYPINLVRPFWCTF
jgi:hypothetical protein